MNLAIQTERLGRIYKIRGGKKTEPKELVALREIDLEVRRGELFGLLGPNGAGKTTLIKVLTTLLAPTSGWARVAGYDVSNEAHKVRPRINMISGGESSGYGLLTVRENLWMFAQFYGITSGVANQRIRELLDVVGLTDRINTKSTYRCGCLSHLLPVQQRPAFRDLARPDAGPRAAFLHRLSPLRACRPGARLDRYGDELLRIGESRTESGEQVSGISLCVITRKPFGVLADE